MSELNMNHVNHVVQDAIFSETLSETHNPSRNTCQLVRDIISEASRPEPSMLAIAAFAARVLRIEGSLIPMITNVEDFRVPKTDEEENMGEPEIIRKWAESIYTDGQTIGMVIPGETIESQEQTHGRIITNAAKIFVTAISTQMTQEERQLKKLLQRING